MRPLPEPEATVRPSRHMLPLRPVQCRDSLQLIMGDIRHMVGNHHLPRSRGVIGVTGSSWPRWLGV